MKARSAERNDQDRMLARPMLWHESRGLSPEQRLARKRARKRLEIYNSNAVVARKAYSKTEQGIDAANRARKKWRESEAGREYHRQYGRSPEQKIKRADYRRGLSKDYQWQSHLKHRYGISPGQYEAMSMAQKWLCAVCGEKQKDGRRLCVDHNHKTGVIRDLLCTRCNIAIGAFGDSPFLLTAAALYLKRHTEGRTP